MAAGLWTLPVFDLSLGNPFVYSTRSISVISGTETFMTGINTRDKMRCVVCGERGRPVLEYSHIVPKVEDETWEDLRDNGFIHLSAKSVEHEARNGVLMCRNHHGRFDAHEFYIRWVPNIERFVLINQSRNEDMEKFHGRAVNLTASDLRTSFHGAFLIHEMRVRGRWPLLRDRQISLPIPWQRWIPDPNVQLSEDHCGGGGDNDGDDRDDRIIGDGNPPPDNILMLSSTPAPHLTPDHLPSHDSNASTGDYMTFTNPFANPVELEGLKRSFATQPNWKSAVVEGES